jgi:hypothetical protein
MTKGSEKEEGGHRVQTDQMQRTYATTVPPTGSGTPPKKDDSELKRVASEWAVSKRVVPRRVVSGLGPHPSLSVWKCLLCCCILGSS